MLLEILKTNNGYYIGYTNPEITKEEGVTEQQSWVFKEGEEKAMSELLDKLVFEGENGALLFDKRNNKIKSVSKEG